MLLSHKYRFIFIKTVKTAGTSIEVELGRFLGPDDVVTPIIPTNRGHTPRNFQRNKQSFYNHMSAREVREHIGSKMFIDYFKFCVEREPVDKCISHYSMLKNSPHHNENNKYITWDSYVSRGCFPIDHCKYIDADGSLMVNKILHYEKLKEELIGVCKTVGLPPIELRTTEKSGFREDPSVSPRQAEIIYSAFSKSNTYTRCYMRSDAPQSA